VRFWSLWGSAYGLFRLDLSVVGTYPKYTEAIVVFAGCKWLKGHRLRK
jgi:hypothetical protein